MACIIKSPFSLSLHTFPVICRSMSNLSVNAVRLCGIMKSLIKRIANNAIKCLRPGQEISFYIMHKKAFGVLTRSSLQQSQGKACWVPKPGKGIPGGTELRRNRDGP